MQNDARIRVDDSVTPIPKARDMYLKSLEISEENKKRVEDIDGQLKEKIVELINEEAELGSVAASFDNDKLEQWGFHKSHALSRLRTVGESFEAMGYRFVYQSMFPHGYQFRISWENIYQPKGDITVYLYAPNEGVGDIYEAGGDGSGRDEKSLNFDQFVVELQRSTIKYVVDSDHVNKFKIRMENGYILHVTEGALYQYGNMFGKNVNDLRKLGKNG